MTTYRGAAVLSMLLVTGCGVETSSKCLGPDCQDDSATEIGDAIQPGDDPDIGGSSGAAGSDSILAGEPAGCCVSDAGSGDAEGSGDRGAGCGDAGAGDARSSDAGKSGDRGAGCGDAGAGDAGAGDAGAGDAGSSGDSVMGVGRNGFLLQSPGDYYIIRDATQLVDGHVVAVGQQTTGNQTDLFMMKLSRGGDVLWQRRLSRPGASTAGYAVAPKSDGGFVVSGVGNDDLMVVEADRHGVVIWSSVYGRSTSYGFAILERSGGGYYVGTAYGAIMLSLDATGDVQWAIQPTYPAVSGDIKAIQKTAGGGAIFAGDFFYTECPPPPWDCTYHEDDIFVLATDSEGVVEWSRWIQDMTILPGEGYNEEAFGVAVHDDGYVIAAHKDKYDTAGAWMVKLDLAGYPMWQKLVDTYHLGQNAAPTTDGGFIIAAQINFAEVDGDGNVVWSNSYPDSRHAATLALPLNSGELFAASSDSGSTAMFFLEPDGTPLASCRTATARATPVKVQTASFLSGPRVRSVSVSATPIDLVSNNASVRQQLCP